MRGRNDRLDGILPQKAAGLCGSSNLVQELPIACSCRQRVSAGVNSEASSAANYALTLITKNSHQPVALGINGDLLVLSDQFSNVP